MIRKVTLKDNLFLQELQKEHSTMITQNPNYSDAINPSKYLSKKEFIDFWNDEEVAEAIVIDSYTNFKKNLVKTIIHEYLSNHDRDIFLQHVEDHPYRKNSLYKDLPVQDVPGHMIYDKYLIFGDEVQVLFMAQEIFYVQYLFIKNMYTFAGTPKELGDKVYIDFYQDVIEEVYYTCFPYINLCGCLDEAVKHAISFAKKWNKNSKIL